MKLNERIKELEKEIKELEELEIKQNGKIYIDPENLITNKELQAKLETLKDVQKEIEELMFKYCPECGSKLEIDCGHKVLSKTDINKLLKSLLGEK